MGITRAQLRMARSALGWSAAELAEAAGVGAATVRRYERGADILPDRLDLMKRALEKGGVVFLAADELKGGGPGVRLKK